MDGRHEERGPKLGQTPQRPNPQQPGLGPESYILTDILPPKRLLRFGIGGKV